MAGGVWSRWGRGSTEGYSLSFGGVRDLRGDVILVTPGTWRTKVGAIERIFPEKEEAMNYIEHELRVEMENVIADWLRYMHDRNVNTYLAMR